MKLLTYIALGILLTFSACKSKKDIGLKENFRISEMQLAAAEYMELNQAQRDEYFEIYKNTERYLKTMVEQELEKNDRNERLKEIKLLQETRLRDFFGPDDYIKHRKFLRNYNKKELERAPEEFQR